MNQLKKYISFYTLLIISLLCLFLVSNSIANQVQRPKAFATVYPYDAKADSAFIGDWLQLYLEAECEEGTKMQWPLTGEKIGDFEVIEVGKIDTIVENGRLKMKQIVNLTAFEAGDYTVPSFVYPYTLPDNKKGQIKTDELVVSVSAPAVDLEADIKPIAGLLELPRSFKEYLPYLAIALLALLIMALMLYLIRKFSNQTLEIEPPAPQLPAHELALKRLQELEKQKYWQQNEVKMYYSELTEIVREYIENRYDIQALELTTDEILAAFKEINIRKSTLKKLEEMLTLSDFVKFAKAKPGIEEHSKHFNGANEFVRKTKKREIIETEE